MSRSYKKFPIVKQERENYHYLNRQLRRDKLAEIPNGRAYRKLNSYFLWQYIWTREEAIEQWYAEEHIRKMYPTLEEWLQYWARCTIRK